VRRLLPALLLLAYGGAFAVRAFGSGLPAFDDHPGQFFRLWHALERSLPDGRWTADWNPDWWGGYPELQFYPPGFALVGAAVRLLTLWQAPVEVVYRLLCALVLILPALATYLLLVRVLDDGWLALPPAFLALTLSAGLRGGVEEGVRWGILTSRLSLGLLPLLALSLRGWIEIGRPPHWAPLATAAVVLAHPAHAPAAAAILGVATLLALALRPRRRTAAEALAVVTLAFGLTAFWLIPLVARRAWVVPLAWGEVGLGGFAGEVRARPVLLAVAAGALLAWGAVVARRRPFEGVLAALPVALLGVVATDAALFRRGWSAIEADRLLDATTVAAIWAAGLGFGALVARLTARRARGPARAVLALVGVGVLALLPGPAAGEATLTLWPRPRAGAWPSLAEISQSHDLPRLWSVLAGTTDRVLFLTSALRLTTDTVWYAPHSHVLSLAPILARREIVHGTYTHPAPLAARFYTGAIVPPARLTTLVEELDGHRLLGQPLERLSADAFEAFARRLRIATVVVPVADADRARFLAERYVAKATAAGFAVFERRDRPWPQVERITHRRYRILVSPTGGVWVPTGIPAYPLWQAKSRHGALETRVDPWGLLEFRVPLDLWEAELVYSEGALEWIALGITVLAIAGCGVWAWRTRSAGAAPRTVPVRSALARRRRPR
jgi:hypothetical protein